MNFRRALPIPVGSLVTILFLAAFMVAVHPACSQERPNNQRVREILAEIDDLWRSGSSSSRVKMEVKTAHYTRSLVMEGWSKGTEMSLVKIVFPLKEKGTASLKNGNTMYTYLPKTDRVIRLTSGMMMGSWMGSHFTNDDLVKESRLSEDYDPSITFEGERNGHRVIEFELIPKPNAPVVWGRIVTLVFSDGYLPLRSLYYDEEGALARTLFFSEIKEIGGRKLPAVLRMIPADKKDEYTELIYEDIVFDIELADSFFSLHRLRQQ